MTRPLLTCGLGSLIAALATRAGARPVVEEVRSTPWSSITFTGARHHFVLRFEGAQAARAVEALTEELDYAEFDLGAHILVDIAVTDCTVGKAEARIAIEALVLAND